MGRGGSILGHHMKSLLTKTLLAGAALLACNIPATAQNTGGDASYGDIDLSAGFTPDPYTINLQSGGSVNAENLGGSCRGYIANSPDVRVRYSSGSLPLIISADSSSDTTLIVNAPNGSWYCDDDSGDGLNPSIRFEKPASGRYEIWVGTYADSTFESATLNISELYSQ